MHLLECDSLSLGYPGGRVLASNLTFSIDSGQCLCIVGENGAGKSTLVKTILHLQAPLEGVIRLGEGIRAQDIGYLPQTASIPDDFPATVQEVVQSGCLARRGWCPFGGRKEKELVHRQLSRLKLSELRKSSFLTCSV